MNGTIRGLAVGLAGLALALPAWAGPEQDLAKANGEGRAVFLIVKEGDARGIDLAREVAGKARDIVEKAAVVELDRLDPANAPLVKRYRLASVETPMILVVASNGAAAGGAKPSQVTANRLARMVPSPKRAEELKALEQGKAVFVVFARAAMAGRAGTLAACETAVTMMEGKAAVVSVDLDDAREASFVETLKVDARTAVPVTVVVNAKGLTTASLTGALAPSALVEAAKKAGECCPGGDCK